MLATSIARATTYADILHVCKSASHLVALTGAGVSTDSGIPDYRSPAGSYSKGHKPMTHDEFTMSLANRRRYWARSLAGYKPFASTLPNAAHHSLARLEQQHVLQQLITQNVDGLHQRAGSSRVLELHGNTHSCTCMQCGASESRARMQTRLQAYNHWLLRESTASALSPAKMRADGDAEIGGVDDRFRVPACEACGGVIKPDVVFFGDSVPAARATRAAEAVAQCDALLIVGTSLSTLSAFRLVEAVSRAGKPIALLNDGETRAERAGLPGLIKLDARCGEVLARLADDIVN